MHVTGFLFYFIFCTPIKFSCKCVYTVPTKRRNNQHRMYLKQLHTVAKQVWQGGFNSEIRKTLSITLAWLAFSPESLWSPKACLYHHHPLPRLLPSFHHTFGTEHRAKTEGMSLTGGGESLSFLTSPHPGLPPFLPVAQSSASHLSYQALPSSGVCTSCELQGTAYFQ